jgi:membrane-associated phospholipid phosphatase
LTLAAATAAARLLVGEHPPSDIAAGALLGDVPRDVVIA